VVNKSQNLILFSLILIWAMLVMAGYYVIHKPIDIQLATGLLRTALDVFTVGALLSLAGGLGKIVLRGRWGDLHTLENLAFEGALGLGMMGLLWLVIGLLGGYSTLTGWLALLLGWGVCFKYNLDWLKQLSSVKELFNRSSRFGIALALAVSFLSFSQIMLAMAPPLKWDALMYHLEIPRQYSELGHFAFLPNNPYWGNPQLGTQLYTWALVLRGFETATVLGWAIFALFALGVLGLLVRITNVESGWVALAALFAGASIRGQMSWGYVDGLVALFGFCVITLLIELIRTRDEKAIYWIGLFSGLSLWSKLTAGLIVICVLAAILVYLGVKQVRTWKMTVIYLFVSLGVFLPWLGILAFFTGNPLYPYLIDTPWVSSERLAYFSYAGSFPGWEILYLPISATWFGIEGGRIEGSLTFGSDIGPLLLMLAVPGLVYGLRERKLEITVAAMVLICGWSIMAVGGLFSGLFWQTRLYFGLLAAVTLAAGFGWQKLSQVVAAGIRLRVIAGGVLVFVMAMTIMQELQANLQLQPARFVLGGETRQAYLARGLGAYAEVIEAVEALPAGSRVLFLWEPRGLYAPPNATPDTWIDRWYLGRLSGASGSEIFQSWREEGYTHLLLYRAGMEFERETRGQFTDEDWKALGDELDNLMIARNFDDIYILYELGE
jgi:hypothetical protein